MSQPTKALSVRSPWWWYILHAGKDIENRDWPTKFRGTVYVHASKRYVHRDVCDDLFFADQIAPGARAAKIGNAHPYDFLLPSGGCIVGTVEIVDCVRKSDSPWFFGKYGFVLANPVTFAEPVPCRGALGFFTVPDDVLAQISEVRS